MESELAADPDRGRRQREVRGPRRRRLADGSGGRNDRREPEGGHRQARPGSKSASDLRPAIVIVDKKGKADPAARRRRGALCAFGRRHSLGGRRRRGEGGRRAGAYSDGRRQDPRHHGRSAARGGAVRSAQAQGLRGARGNRRLYRVRQGLQEQAPRDPEAEEREAGADRVSDPEGASTSACARAIMWRRATSSSKAILRRTTSCASRAWRNWRSTWSRKSRRSIGCRA